MREWNLKPGDPLSLILAADARMSQTDYTNDQIWELSLEGGEPPALAVQTTFGLRARSLRLFPRFTIDDQTITDPAEFTRPVIIHQFYPNFLSLTFSPFSDIDVKAEYWVPQSHAVAGRLELTNQRSSTCKIKIEWVGQLTPTDGQRMAPLEIQAAPALSGSTDGLTPVVFLTGGPKVGSGSYPSLVLEIELGSGASHSVIWSHSASSSAEESFTLARDIAARVWDAERTRIELLNSGLIEVYTGDTGWDAAFALSQKHALSLFVGPTENMPEPSFVFTRQPDQGFSMRGDGSDYNHLWNGQSPIDAYYLTDLILPGSPELAAGLLKNFLAIQEENGFIDWKPGLAGQLSRLLATPLLATLAWRIYEITKEDSFLEETFPGLLRFFQAWFTPQRDRDGDGIPEWDHPMQSGSEESPIFSRWHPWSQGIEISTAESPALCAFLFREAKSLIKIARHLNLVELIPELISQADHLATALESAWDPEDDCYHDWDRDTHLTPRGEWLASRMGPGEIILQRSFEHPVRLLIRIQTSGESTRHPQLFIHGSSASGHHRVENLSDEQFKWYLGMGTLTGERVYTYLERLEILGLDNNDEVNVYTAGYYCLDQSLLLPLWAGTPDEERAKRLVENTITNPIDFWHPYGLPACARPPEIDEAEICQSINLPWNAMIGTGLIRYGYRQEAAELVTRIMKGIVDSLKRDRCFRRYYHADTGQGIGDRNALQGLAPLGLFLEALGVRLISPHRVALSGFNPFPWPVTVKYRGLTVMRQREKTMVIFPDGQTVTVDDPEPRIVSLEFQRS